MLTTKWPPAAHRLIFRLRVHFSSKFSVLRSQRLPALCRIQHYLLNPLGGHHVYHVLTGLLQVHDMLQGQVLPTPAAPVQ